MRLELTGGTMYHDQGIAGLLPNKEMKISANWESEFPYLRNNSLLLCPSCISRLLFLEQCHAIFKSDASGGGHDARDAFVLSYNGIQHTF